MCSDALLNLVEIFPFFVNVFLNVVNLLETPVKLIAVATAALPSFKLQANRNRPFSSRLQFFCAFIKSIKSTYFLRYTAFEYFSRQRRQRWRLLPIFFRASSVVNIPYPSRCLPVYGPSAAQPDKANGVGERDGGSEREGTVSTVQICNTLFRRSEKEKLVYVLFTWNRCALLASPQNLMKRPRHTENTR